jgi:hypothetical protein
MEARSQAAESAEEARPSGTFDWGLKLPDNPVSRRTARTIRFDDDAAHALAEIDGPGCIRRFWCTGRNIGREVILRIYFDDQPVPCVEAPLADFFGLMHNRSERGPLPEKEEDPQGPLAERGPAYRINTPFLVTKPRNSMTCYFPMPFAKKARLEVTGRKGSVTLLYYMIDWHEYPGRELNEPMRFCSRWRRESPTVPYADQFLVLDAGGPGRLIGFVYSVDMLNSRHEMRWSHAGGDKIYIDGDGPQPTVLTSLGGEDTFGASYGGAGYAAGTSLDADMPYYVQKDPKGDKQKLVGYRFFLHDSVFFRQSIFMRYGCREHDIASTVYWYSTKPVRPFCTMPPYQDRLPGSVVGRKYDLPLPDCGGWWLAGRFAEDFQEPLPTAAGFSPDHPYQKAPWRRYASKRGWVEFGDFYGPACDNSLSPVRGTYIACCALESPRDTKATLRVGWDERLTLRVNDESPRLLPDHAHFQSATIDVRFRKGRNFVAVRPSPLPRDATCVLARTGSCFSFSCTTADGAVLKPTADGANAR